MRTHIRLLTLGFAAASIAGCLGGGDESSVAPVPFEPVNKEPFVPNAAAGIPVEEIPDPEAYKKVVASSRFGSSRSDPFALTGTERAFDVQQSGERLFAEGGTFDMFYTPPPPPDDTPVMDPQPYRRLSGVVVGDSVLAIIELGDGRTEIIRPGQRIPNTEWTVVSIDENKAVLRRGGNRLPREITVRLEPAPPGMGGSGAAPGGGPGMPGRPGGMPGGMPGRPGMGPAGPGGPTAPGAGGEDF